MSTFKSFSIVLLIIVQLLACNSKKSDEKNDQATGDSDSASSAQATCVWDNVPVLEGADDKSKYITALSIGETVTMIALEAVDSSKAAKEHFHVKLVDGTSGWVRKDFIVPDSKPMVFIRNADTYSRPEALTKTTKKFSKYDIVAVSTTKDDFASVKGKRADGKWIEVAWVKATNLSDEVLNITAAKFIAKAVAEKDPQKREKALNEVFSSPDLRGSIFANDRMDTVAVPTDTVSRN